MHAGVCVCMHVAHWLLRCCASVPTKRPFAGEKVVQKSSVAAVFMVCLASTKMLKSACSHTSPLFAWWCKLFVSTAPRNSITANSNIHGFEVHRPSSKDTKLLFQVIKAIINQDDGFWQNLGARTLLIPAAHCVLSTRAYSLLHGKFSALFRPGCLLYTASNKGMNHADKRDKSAHC